jgi:transcriptional regulator with XRE-family HTH domain
MFKRLKILREKNNLTQAELAKILGISQSRYSLYENGKKEISIKVLSNIANFYETSIDFIIGDTDEIKRH